MHTRFQIYAIIYYVVQLQNGGYPTQQVLRVQANYILTDKRRRWNATQIILKDISKSNKWFWS